MYKARAIEMFLLNLSRLSKNDIIFFEARIAAIIINGTNDTKYGYQIFLKNGKRQAIKSSAYAINKINGLKRPKNPVENKATKQITRILGSKTNFNNS
jgi:hypothetical protein